MNVHNVFSVSLAATGMTLAISAQAVAAGDAARGATDFQRACAACHSTAPNVNMTGPSLAGIWNRKAGSLASFSRYSPALRASSVVWNDKSLDAWLKNPATFIPNNQMPFQGIGQSQPRADLIAYLQAVSSGKPPQMAQAGGGMMGGMMGNQDQNLKQGRPSVLVKSATYCRDTYRITTADGKEHVFWERNLRVQTDSRDIGPAPGKPALVPAGMMGDRADLIFAKPEEISAFLKQRC